MSLPKVVVFDLDYTLWPFWCDTHIVPPTRPSSDHNEVVDRQGDCFTFYRDVPELLKYLSAQKNIQLCIASRTQSPKTAKALLDTLYIDGEPASRLFSFSAWGTGSKVSHFKDLKKLTGVDFHDMLFFDDETRNKDVERRLGVQFVEVRSGMSLELFHEGVALWRKRIEKLENTNHSTTNGFH